MRALAATFVCLGLLVQQMAAAEEHDLIVPLPRALQAGEKVFLEVQLGVLPRGQQIEVATPSGRSLGVISPHGIRTGEASGIYLLPVPADAVVKRQVTLRLSLSYAGKKRAPTADEVKSVKAKIAPAGR